MCRTRGSTNIFQTSPHTFAMRDTIGTELDQLEKKGILEKVSHSDG